MISNTAKGLQEMFNAKPELFDVVKDLVENTASFLYDSEGGGDHHIDSWNESIPALLEAMREVPALREWVKQIVHNGWLPTLHVVPTLRVVFNAERD